MTAAKQEAFEESIRLKNQFRNLDEDEIEFLDSVLESTRVKEEAVEKETKEQLDLFRRQQEEADKALLDAAGNNSTVAPATAGSPLAEEGQWAVNGRKRKRAKEKEVLKGVKLRRSSSTSGQVAPPTTETYIPSILNPKSNPSSSKPVQKEGDAIAKDIGITTGITPSFTEKRSVEKDSSTSSSAKPANGGLPGLGLGDYSSDDES